MSKIDNLLEVTAKLRDPENGCPWDLKQTFKSVAPYTLEEAYEVADAIEQGDIQGLQGELGDLLFQVVLHAQMAADQGLFDFDEVAQGITQKMISRHPHVFSDTRFATMEDQKQNWEAQKREERASKREGTLAGISINMPALSRSTKLQKRAASVGFDWSELQDVWAKLNEELQELDEAKTADDPAAMEEELGDVLFSLVNLSRWLKVDAESALRRAASKFEQRFNHMEQHSSVPLETLSAQQLDALWRQAKTALSKSTESI